MLFSFYAEIELDDDYGICHDCKIEMEWNSIFQPSYMNLTSGSSGTLGSCTTNVNSGTTTCTSRVTLDGGQKLRFNFYDMLVNTGVGSGLSSEVHFFEKFWVYGNWNRDKCIYNCDSLESNTVSNCNGFIVADNKITIDDTPRWLEIREVRLIPGNANPNWYQDLYIKFQLDTTLRAADYRHDTYLSFAVPTSYNFQSTGLNRRDIFSDFYGKPTISANGIRWDPYEDMVKGQDYTFTITQAVKAPSSNAATTDAFTGFSSYKSTTVDASKEGTTTYSDSMYAQLKSYTAESSSLTLNIWPNLRAEKAHYHFEFTPANEITSLNEIWIQFDADYFDYHVYDTLAKLEPSNDRDNVQLREVTCLVKNKLDNNYHSQTVCYVKRSTVMIKHKNSLLAQADGENPVYVELVGVTNPDTDQSINFKLWVMNSGASGNNDEHVKEAWTATKSYVSKASLKFNLFEVKADNRNVREAANYEFWFENIANDNAVYHDLKKDATKFMVFFPDEYAIAPASLAHHTANEQKVGDCMLYEIDYMSSYYDSTDRMYVENLPTCNYNYLHHYLGNAVEFLAPAVTIDTVNDQHTNARIERYNGTDTTDWLQYVFTLKAVNPQNGYLTYNFKNRYDFDNKNLWPDYETYSRKFWMALYDTSITDCSSNNCARGYGVLTSNWIGFDNDPKPLYVWDDKGMIITEQNPMRVGSGQQSRWMYVGTGQGFKYSRDLGLTNDFVKFSSPDTWVEFGPNNNQYN